MPYNMLGMKHFTFYQKKYVFFFTLIMLEKCLVV